LIHRPLTRLIGIALAIYLGPGLGAVAAEGFEPPPDFKARYEVRKAGITLGRADLRFAQPLPGRYRYSLHTRASGLARLLFSSEVYEQSHGRILDDGFRPDFYRYKRSGDDKARVAELRFDWLDLEVVNDVADYPWRMDITHDTIDRVIGPLQLMHDLAERDGDDDQLVYRIADGGQLKTYLLTIEGTEMIDTPMGAFEAIRIRRRDTDSNRETRLWCAPELDYLAVRVEQHEDGDQNFRLSLAALDGLDSSR
jgi:hypothetical protein